MESQNQNNEQCKFLETCRFIFDNKDRMPELVHNITSRYCCGRFDDCSRKWLAEMLDENIVPALMLPNQWEWAHQIHDDIKSQEREVREKDSDSVAS